MTNVLSLFDGISCGQQALERLGIKPDKYYSSEIDKYAISITQNNYPDTIQLGDVTKWREWDIDWASIDLVMGGSPCQGFSMAGKQLAFDDPRSALFFVFVDIRNHIQKFNPEVKFLLENVRMKKDYLDVISQYIGVEPVMVNSALVSAQNRVRFYWANWEITQPEDRGILLKDILEDGFTERDKSLVVTTRVAGATPKRYIEKSQHQMVITGGAMRGRYNKDGKTEQKLEVQETGRANSITTVQKDSLLIRVGSADIKGHDSIKRIYSDEGKAPTLTTMGGGHRESKVAVREATKQGYALAGENDFVDLSFPNSKTRRGRVGKNGKTNTITASLGESGVLDKELNWRKLTPLECERLQTVEDKYTAQGVNDKGEAVPISNTQRYKALGNGWTVEVIKHILKQTEL